TVSATRSDSPTRTATGTFTVTRTATPTRTVTSTRTQTATQSPFVTKTVSATRTVTSTWTPTPSTPILGIFRLKQVDLGTAEIAADGAIVTERKDVYGTATAGLLDHWTLEVALSGSGVYTQIGSGSSP